MKHALDMAFVGMGMLFMAYMVLTVFGFYDGRCIVGFGAGILVTWMLARSDDDDVEQR